MPAQDVHRLKDIQVEEVSLVDRAANKRRFLLVKRDDMDLKPNGRGGFTRMLKADADEDEEKRKAKEAEAEKAKGKPAPEDKSEADTTEAGRGDGDVNEDEEKRKAAEKQITQLEAAGLDVSALKAIFDNDEKKKARKADEAGAALAEQLADHIEALQELCEELAEREENEPSDEQMDKLTAAHKAMGETIGKYAKKSKSEKMSKTNKTNFAKALDTLQSLLGELLETPAKAKEHDAEPGDPQGSPKGWSAANPSGVPTGEAGTAGGFVGKREHEELKSLVKRQAEEIASLKKGVAPSNSRSVERVGKSAPVQEAAWPMDMNDDRYDRSKVDKSTSFYDD